MDESAGDYRGVLGDPAAAASQAAAFARWAADPAVRSGSGRQRAAVVAPRQVNDDLRSVAELFAFMAASPAGTRPVLGPAPRDGITAAHPAGRDRPGPRIPHHP